MANKVGHTALKDALNAFRQLLTPTEYSDMLRSSDLAASSVVEVTASMDQKKSKYGAKRILPFLESIHQFSSIVDTFIQTDPKISALVWGSAKFLIMVAMNFLSYFEKLAEMIEKLGFLCPVFDRIHKLYPDSIELGDSVCVFYATVITFCTDALKFLKANGLRQFQKTLWRPFKLQFSDIERSLQEQSENIDRELAIASEIAACRERQVASLYRHQGYQHRELQLKYWEESREWRVQHDFRQKEERRKHLLDKISDYDHTYSFLRARSQRYEGTGQWVAESAEFQGWYQGTRSTGLWYHGIPGSGKTVMTTGIIDYIFSHRQRSSMICYFFCDFANRRSLEIWTVISSFIKQILNVFTMPPELEGKLEDLYGDAYNLPTVDQLFQILISAAQLPDITYFIIDGLDECSDNDKRRLLLYINNLLRIHDKIKVLVSSRNEVEISLSLESFYKVSLDTPTTCSDIEAFVEAKLKDKVEEGSLILENSSMIGEIKETLVLKSEGMFLWVALQLDDICKENNDNDIRQALRSLPLGLNETYARILQRIIEHRKPDVAKKLLNWIAGARRPLHLDELVEAISFEPGDTLWDQGRHRFPTSQTKMLQNCGNLVTVTHSEDGSTIQFVHYTAFEFLLSHSSKAVRLGFHLEMQEANNLIGSVCVTYLSLADFETQVTSLPTKQAVNIAPGLLVSLLPSVTRRIWSFAERHFWQPAPEFDFGEILGPQTVIKPSDALKQKFRLLGYATEHWINHYSNLSPDNHDKSAWILFEDLIRSGRLPLPWESDVTSDDLPYAAQFRWAVMNGHVGIFSLTMDNVKSAIGKYTKLDCRGVTPIVLSCSLGHDIIVEMLLRFGISVHERSQDRTLLEVAAAGGHLTVIDRLLQANADVNAPAAQNISGQTALQAATEGGYLAVVDRLLQAKADVNARANQYGRTALQAAAAAGHLAIINRLLQAEANVNAPAEFFISGRTALQAAAERGHLAVVDRLLQANADVNAPAAKSSGRTALQAAAAGGHLAVIDRLLQAKANANAPAGSQSGQTALQAATAGGHLGVVDRLLRADADVNAPAAISAGRTALQAAAEGGHLVVVDRLLLEADINAPAVEYNGRTALQAAAARGHLAVVDRLLQADADVNAPAGEKYGRTALQAAAGGGHLTVVDRLLQANADANAPAAEFGRTALQAAAEGGHFAVVDRLLLPDLETDINAPAAENNGQTALQAAAAGGHLDVVDRLLQVNADINAPPSEYGLTALQAASKRGHLAVVDRILQADTDANAPATNDDILTAIHAAIAGGHLAVVDRLRGASTIE